MSNEPLLRVENLKKYFPIRKGVFSRVAAQVKAVDDISFRIDKGETLGLVGESGCGKTTAGRSVLRIIEPTSGEVRFQGVDVLSLAGQELRDIRKHMQIIFQDPYGSLNPRMTVGAIVGEYMAGHGIDNPGLGYYIFMSSQNFQTEILFASIFLSTLLGVAMVGCVSLLSRTLLARWTYQLKH